MRLMIPFCLPASTPPPQFCYNNINVYCIVLSESVVTVIILSNVHNSIYACVDIHVFITLFGIALWFRSIEKFLHYMFLNKAGLFLIQCFHHFTAEKRESTH